MQTFIICVTVVLIVLLLCITSIYLRERQRYEEVISSKEYRNLSEQHNKLIGRINSIVDYSKKAIETTDNESLSKEFKLEFNRTTLCTIHNNLVSYLQ